MFSLNKTIKGVSFIGACVFVMLASSTTLRAVDPPPDGGYDNFNTAEGDDALFSLTSGFSNTAIGFETLFSDTTGVENTAVGYTALFANSTGSFNSANGYHALLRNTTGGENTADGLDALRDNTIGSRNAASGNGAMSGNTTGSNNTAHGYNALALNSTGKNNIALGFNAGSNLSTGNNNIDISNVGGAAGESNTIRIGTTPTHRATYIAGISGATVAGGVGVVIDTNGRLGTIVSSACYKDAIKPMDKTSEAILSLQPVTFRYKHDLDPDGIPQFGLVAKQVEKVNPDLVARDEQGKPYTVRYEAVNAMLLNEFLKEHKRVGEQEAAISDVKSTAAKQATTIAQQQKEIQALTEALKAQSVQIQKVSDQLKAQPVVVANN